jgi:phage shock protein PspC (stress-responsive transcriptional regulator)
MGDPATGSGRIPSALYRHPIDKLIGGVCGGLADYFAWDPALVRILWVVATLATGGGGLLAYVALWALLPVGTAQEGQRAPAAVELNERSLSRAAMILMALGGLWLLANIGILPWLWGALWRVASILFWPALLFGAGYLLFRQTGKGQVNVDLRGAAGQARARVGSWIPTGAEVRGGLRSMREKFPLKRSRQDRIFLGVCGGIGKRLGIDANLVRLIWAAFSVGSIGMGVLIYVLLAWMMPEEGAAPLSAYSDDSKDVPIIDVNATRTF